MTLTITDKKTKDEAIQDGFSKQILTFEEREKELEEIRKRAEDEEKKAKFSPFSRWTQFNLEHTQKMMWLQLKHPKAAAILSFLIDQMDKYNAVICSYKVLTEILDVSTETIRKSIKVLKENGFLAVLKSGSSNVYAINDSVFWKSWGKNRLYSKFPANVVLSETEQEKFYKEKIGFERLKEIVLKKKTPDAEADGEGEGERSKPITTAGIIE